MKIIVDELVLTDNVKEALLGGDNEIKKVLDMVISHASLKLNSFNIEKKALGITRERFMSLYVKALMWVRKLDY